MSIRPLCGLFGGTTTRPQRRGSWFNWQVSSLQRSSKGSKKSQFLKKICPTASLHPSTHHPSSHLERNFHPLPTIKKGFLKKNTTQRHSSRSTRQQCSHHRHYRLPATNLPATCHKKGFLEKCTPTVHPASFQPPPATRPLNTCCKT